MYLPPSLFLMQASILHAPLSFPSLSGTENGRCVASEYFTEPEIEITTENTANILSEYTVPYTYSFTLQAQHRAHQLVALKNGNELPLFHSYGQRSGNYWLVGQSLWGN